MARRNPGLPLVCPHMNYADYSTEDFLADESFQLFVLENEPAATAFWQNWRCQHPTKEPAFDEAAALLRLLLNAELPAPAALKHAELAKLWHALHEQPVRPAAQPALRTSRAARRVRQWRLALLSLLVLTLAGLGLRSSWRRPAPASWIRYAAGPDQPRALTLPDGSRVVLSARSALRLAATWPTGQAREVWLTGGAYFDVRHTAPARLKTVAAAAPNAKFVVHIGPLDVAVLGTQFNVLSQGTATKVVLSSGQVQLSRRWAGHLDQVLLKPGEQASYDTAAPQAPLVARPVRAALYAAWASGQLDFDDTPMADIITLLQDTYGLKISLTNPRLAGQRLSGSVPTYDLDVLLTTLGKSLDVPVRRSGRHVRFG